jgi:uncharacterized protein (TIGR02246 family)
MDIPEEKKMNFIKAAAVSILASATVAGCASATPGQNPTAIAADNFSRWEAALASGSPATVTALFSPDAVLEPTVSNEVRTTPDRIQAYFVDFLKLSPRPQINQRTVIMLDENTMLDAGVWTFDLTNNGTASFVTARYSFVWEKEGGVWKIQLLHSSLMPEPVASRLPPL